MAATEATTTATTTTTMYATPPFARRERVDEFLKAESKAALLNRCGNYFSQHQGATDEAHEHYIHPVAHWPTLLTEASPRPRRILPSISSPTLAQTTASSSSSSSSSSPATEAPVVSPGTSQPVISDDTRRLFTLDSVRTFVEGSSQQRYLEKFLERLVLEAMNGEYYQGLSLLSGLLLLSFDEETVLDMIYHLNQHPKYIPGYWRHELVVFSTDAYVTQSLYASHVPEVAALLQQSGILPNMFLQKWYLGLCINVLPFRHLYRFLERFLAEGHLFLLRFSLSFLRNLQPQLLACGADTAKLLAWLRLEDDLLPLLDDALLTKIVDDANAELFPLADLRLDELRTDCFDRYLRRSLEAAALETQNKKKKEKNGSDDDDGNDDDDDDESEEEEFGCQGQTEGGSEDECEEEPVVFAYTPSEAVILCLDCVKKPKYATWKRLKPNDLYQFCQKPEVAKKLADARKLQALSSGLQALKIE